MVLAVAAAVLGVAVLVPATYVRLSGRTGAGGGGGGSPAAVRTTPTPPPTLTARPVSVSFEGSFFSWALLERKTGKLSGAKNMTATSSTESMLKVWIVADYLRRLGEKQPSPERLTQARIAIVDSDDDAANALWNAGGRSAVLNRLIRICGLTETAPGTVPGYRGWWSFTTMSPRDAVRMGDCVASGRAAGPRWTQWLLDTMSEVRGSIDEQWERSGGGRWGIIDGLPDSILDQGPVSIKNGWTRLNYDGNWHVNCLALTKDWVLAAMMRYPGTHGLSYGARTCARVASQLVTPAPDASPSVPEPSSAAES